MSIQEKMREELAELEHLQWIEWARNIMVKENLSPERIERWNKLMIPYSQLTEEQKDQDRIWADKSLETLSSQGVVIKTDGELPDLDELLVAHAKGDAYYELQDELKNWDCERDGKRMQDADWLKWREADCISQRYGKKLKQAGCVAVESLEVGNEGR